MDAPAWDAGNDLGQIKAKMNGLLGVSITELVIEYADLNLYFKFFPAFPHKTLVPVFAFFPFTAGKFP